MHKKAVDVTFTQMSANKGIKKHGEMAVAAVLDEFKKFKDYDAVEAVNPDVLSKEEKRRALNAYTLIKEKRCGKLRAQTVADGRPQRA